DVHLCPNKRRTHIRDGPGRREAAFGQCRPSCTTSHNQLVTAQRTTAASAATAITTADQNRLSRSGRWGGSAAIAIWLCADPNLPRLRASLPALWVLDLDPMR